MSSPRPRSRRLISLKHQTPNIVADNQSTKAAAASAGVKVPSGLMECVFVAGIYHDQIEKKQVAFVREKYPTEYNLPAGIAEFCFPDADSWMPHSPELTRTYMLMLTGPDGARARGYCRRVRPEGDNVCVPLAICILTRQRDVRLYSRILSLLCDLYGRSNMPHMDVFLHLYHQPFPAPGDGVAVLLEDSRGRVVHRPQEGEGQTLEDPEVESIFTMLSFQQVLTLFSATLREKRVVVLSPSLSLLSVLFENLESLLSPLRWQHSLIPALPVSHLAILEAPTPYLIGVICMQGGQHADTIRDVVWKKVQKDPDCLVIEIKGRDDLGVRRSSVLKKPKPPAESPPSRAYQTLPRNLISELRKKKKLSPSPAAQKFQELRARGSSSLSRSVSKDGLTTGDHVRLLLMCQFMQDYFQKLFEKVADFVICDPLRGRVFCVQDFVDSFLGSENYAFVSELSTTAMFGHFIKSHISSLDIEHGCDALDETAVQQPAGNEPTRTTVLKKKHSIGHSTFYD